MTESPTLATSVPGPTARTYPAPAFSFSNIHKRKGRIIQTFVAHYPRIVHAKARFRACEMEIRLTDPRRDHFHEQLLLSQWAQRDIVQLPSSGLERAV